MRFTQAQVRILLGLGEETFRHWRSALPPLAPHQGHAPTFTLGDILALAVVSEIVKLAGGKVSKLRPRAKDLFEVCAEVVDADDRRAVLMINPHHITRLSSANVTNPLISTMFLVPAGRLLGSLRAKIQGSPELDTQLTLPLERQSHEQR